MKRAVKSRHLLLVVALLPVSTCSGHASGQSRDPTDGSDVRIVSSFVPDGSPVPVKCRNEANTFARTLLRYPRPPSWHWILVCDETGWRRFLRLSGRDERAAIYASTDLSERKTYIRGDKLLIPYDLGASPDAIIAHELAHIRLQSPSERDVDRLAQFWLGNPNTGSP